MKRKALEKSLKNLVGGLTGMAAIMIYGRMETSSNQYQDIQKSMSYLQRKF